jgi:hypothetical protein
MPILPFLLLAIAGSSPSGDEPARIATAVRAAEHLLAQQTPDGAITMGKIGEGQCWVVSYFGCFGAQGLLAAYTARRDRRFVDGALNWVQWYEAHQNADGTIFDYKGRPGDWQSTGHFDSTDSYAAVYLDLLKDVFRATGDRTWLLKRSASISRAMKGIRLTMQPCGLTLAKPDYAVMYTMDNVESLLGLRAAASLCKALGDSRASQEAGREADKMEAAIESSLWNGAAGCYRIGIQPDGGKMEGLKDWYPDVMANLMAVAWLPPSPRHQALYRMLIAKFGGWSKEIATVDDLEHAIWWGWAALGASDHASLERLTGLTGAFERLCADGLEPGLLGHVARLCAAP